MFDPSLVMPRGIAYSFPQSWLRLNIPASKMGGAVEGSTTGFAEWLDRKRGLPPSEYVTRFIFGDYLTELFAALISSGNCRVERGEVTSVRPLEAGGYRISTGDEATDVDTAVLCTGHLPPNSFLQEHPRIVSDVWAPGALDDIESDDRLLVIGTGATAVDVILTLQRASHRGLITMISPHGHLPIVDAPEERYPEFFDMEEDDLRPLSVLRRLREEARRAEKAGLAWQNVLGAFRNNVSLIWQRWSPRERRQFLRHGSQMWLVHRHRLPPDVAKLMASFVAEKKIEIRRARYKSLQETRDGFDVQLAVGGASTQITVNRILNTTGPSLAFNRATRPLYRQLFAEKMARQDDLGLGLQVDDASRLLDDKGEPQRGLYVLGSATRGHFWEVTAVPDIRFRASFIADHIRESSFRNGRVVRSGARRAVE